MSSIPGTENTTEVLEIGGTFTGSLDGPTDIDWIKLQNGTSANGDYATPAYLSVSGPTDLTNAQVTVYRHVTSFGRDYWTKENYSIEDLADDVGRQLWVPQPGSGEEIFVSFTGFTGGYSLTFGDADSYLDNPYDDNTNDVDIVLNTEYSGTLDYTTDRDFFRFESAVDGHFYKIIVTPSAELLASDVNLNVSSSWGNNLHFVDDGNGGGHFETTGLFTPISAGGTSISIDVRGYDDERGIYTLTDMGYTVEIQDLGTDIGRTNTSAATAQNLAVGSTQQETIAALDLEQFYSFTGTAGNAYIVVVDGGYSIDLETATGIHDGTEYVIGSNDLYGWSSWDHQSFHSFTTKELDADTQFTFSVQNQSYLADDTFDISIFEVTDAVGNTTDDATTLSVGTTVTEDIHFRDIDVWSFEVEEGEFYTITLDYDPDSNFSAFIGQEGPWNDRWQVNSSYRLGKYEYVFAAYETGTVQFSVNNITQFSRSGVHHNLTQADLQGLTYDITVTQGIDDDRAELSSPFAAPPITLNEITPGLSGELDVDGYQFNVVAGTRYTVVINDPDAFLSFYSDRDNDGNLQYYLNDYPNHNLPGGDGFAEQAALLAEHDLDIEITQLDSGIMVSFTPDYTGKAGFNVYLSSPDLTYSVYVGDNGVSPSVLETLGIGGLVLNGDGTNNLLTGGNGDDTLNGGAGNDTLHGGAGADELNGGSGFDVATYQNATSHVNLDLRSKGTAGDAAGDRFSSIEAVIGSEFSDYIYGNGANNVVIAGRGHDRLRGDAGNDTLEGGIGRDHIHGGSGVDTAAFATAGSGVTVNLTSGTGTRGNAAGDTYVSIENLLGSSHSDLLTGSSGNNLLEGGRGHDTLRGSAGNDRIEGGIGRDEINGGSGTDTAMFTTAGSGVTVNLTSGVGTRGNAAGDTYVSIENLLGSSHSDLLTGSSGNNLLEGGRGHDTLRGSAGNDRIEGGVGRDEINGGSGTDTAMFTTAGSGVTVNLTSGVGTRGNAAGDTYVSIENLLGSDHADLLTGSSGNNLLEGGRGHDTLRGSAGNDRIEGGVGRDEINGGSGTDTAAFATAGAGVTVNLTSGTGTRGNAAGDTYVSIENVIGSNYGDIITGSSGRNILVGGRGDDLLRGSAGNDLLRGGLGNDTLNGGSGADEFRFETALNAGSNIDTIENYSVPQDRITLDNRVFTAVGADLSSAEFRIGTTAQDANDYIIYNPTTGALYYDADGNGNGAQVQFATLDPSLALTASEFDVI